MTKNRYSYKLQTRTLIYYDSTPCDQRLEERLHLLGGNREYIQVEMGILKMKTLMLEIKITEYGIIRRFNNAEEIISVHEDITIETNQNEALKKINNI